MADQICWQINSHRKRQSEAGDRFSITSDALQQFFFQGKKFVLFLIKRLGDTTVAWKSAISVNIYKKINLKKEKVLIL